jgi:hypothetical protein
LGPDDNYSSAGEIIWANLGGASFGDEVAHDPTLTHDMDDITAPGGR